MATNWLLRQEVDLAKPDTARDVVNAGYIYRDDNSAHVWEITCLRDGAAASLSAYTVRGYFIRADNTTVTITGTKSANVATVQLNASCYAYRGLLRGTIRLERTGEVITIGAMHVRVDVATTDRAALDNETLARFSASIAGVEAALADTENYYPKSQIDTMLSGYVQNGTSEDVDFNGDLDVAGDMTLGGAMTLNGEVSVASDSTLFFVSTYQVSFSTIAANGDSGDVLYDVSLDGYSPIGVVGFNCNGKVAITVCIRQGNNVKIRCRNYSTSAASGSFSVYVHMLYVRLAT